MIILPGRSRIRDREIVKGEGFMKKGFLVLAAVLLLVTFIPRPVTAAIDFNLGVKAGVSMSAYKWTGESYSKSLTRPVFGVFFAFNLNRSFAIQPEVYYLTHGGIYVAQFEGSEYKYVDIDNYLHVPILAKYRFMPDKKLSPILFAGPAVDFLLSAHYKYFLDGVEQWNKDVKPFLKNTSFNIVFGAGVEYKMDKLMLIFDIRYDLGLTNIDTDNDPTDELKVKALMFMVGVGF
jgi:hypothetical protein